ncbi:hypothetical protein L6258_03925 [Candidatus Parcubacteria bacterium]|nr:hypothetical protein [Candidatus Parcubacteria bacterium]
MALPDGKALELIEKAEKIVVAANPERGIDGLAAALALANLLAEREKTVELVYPGSVPPSLQEPSGSVAIRKSPRGCCLVISFRHGELPVEKVSYKTDAKTFNLILHPAPFNFNPSQLTFKTVAPEIDLLVALGFGKAGSLSDLCAKFGWRLPDLTVLNINDDPDTELFGQANIIEAASSLSHLLFKKFSVWGEVPSPTVARVLLEGLTAWDSVPDAVSRL